ncbi:MAG: hypothetical protein V4707_07060 [Pseudomonadota bacterium]
MTPLAEMLPTMTDGDLTSLRANAQRLSASNSAVQAATAAEVMPLIDAELAHRAANKPVAVKKPRVAVKKVLPVTGHQTALDTSAA